MDPQTAQSVWELASTWQIVAAAAAVWAVVATFAAPVIGARLTANWQERQERKRLKLWVFGTLMQDRAVQITPEAVRAYNLIDALFHDARDVRDKWGDYYNSLGDDRLNSAEGGRIREDKRNALLRAVAMELGLGRDFTSEDFSRVYLPQGVAEQYDLARLQQQVDRHDLAERLQKRRQSEAPWRTDDKA